MTEKDQMREYVDARNAKEKLEDELKIVNAELQKAEIKLVESLLDREATKTATYPDMGSISLMKPKLRASYLKGNMETVFEFVKKNGYEDIIKPQIGWQSFDAFIKDLVNEGKEIPMDGEEPLVKYYYQQSVRWNKK